MNQLSLMPQSDLRAIKARTLGGEKLRRRRKVKRPLYEGLIHHVVFKSSKAKGEYSLYRHKSSVHSILTKQSRKFFVEILDFVNMGNHLHLKIRFRDKKRAQKFLKSFSAMVARKVTGARRGKPFGRTRLDALGRRLNHKFWDGLVYTRVLLTRLEELGLRGYFEGNHRQRELGYAERTRYLKQFNSFLYRLRQRKAAARGSGSETESGGGRQRLTAFGPP